MEVRPAEIEELELRTKILVCPVYVHVGELLGRCVLGT